MAETLLFQCLFGMKCNDFAIIAADQSNTLSILVMKDGVFRPQKILNETLMERYREAPMGVQIPRLKWKWIDEDKLIQISDRLLMGVNGDMGDVGQFTQLISRHLKLYSMRNGYQLNTKAAVHYTRTNLTDVWRREVRPYFLNILIAGYDEMEGGQLYTMDFLASCVRQPFAAHGFGGHMGISILSEYYKPNLSEVEAYEVIKLCVREVHRRLFLNLPNFGVKTVSKDGVKTLPTISPASFVGK